MAVCDALLANIQLVLFPNVDSDQNMQWWGRLVGSMANIIVANVVIHHVQDVVKNDRQFLEKFCSRSGNARRALRTVCNAQAVRGSSNSGCELFWSAQNLVESYV